MFKINGEDIETKYMLEVASEGDTRERTYLNHKYIKPFFESTKIQVPEFKNNGTPMTFCTKGGRPSFTEVISYAPAPPPSGDVQEWSISFSKPKTKNPATNFLSTWSSTDTGKSIKRNTSTCYVVELVAGGGGGTGGGALLAGVGGGAGAYAAIVIDTNKLEHTLVNGVYEYAKVTIRMKPLNDNPSDSDFGGIGAPNRGTATNGRDIEVIYEKNGEESVVINCQGGRGASGGDPGSGGAFSTLSELPNAISVLYSANGLSASEGVSSSTIVCPQNTLIIGYEDEGDEYKLTRGGFSGVTDGGGASSGAPSQFGNGGAEGKTNNGYSGGDADETAHGAGGGGGHGKAFSQSDGGDGGRPTIIVYAQPNEYVAFSDMSWEEIASISKSGEAQMMFGIGDEKTITLNTGEEVTLVILGFDQEDLADGSGKAGLTIGAKNSLNKTYGMNSGSAEGWAEISMRNTVMATLFSQLPVELQMVITMVSKKSVVEVPNIVTTSDKLWLSGVSEIFSLTSMRNSSIQDLAGNASIYEMEGKQYEYYKNIIGDNNGGTGENPLLVKRLGNGNGSAQGWWLRSSLPRASSSYFFIASSGELDRDKDYMPHGVSFCFCV